MTHQIKNSPTPHWFEFTLREVIEAAIKIRELREADAISVPAYLSDYTDELTQGFVIDPASQTVYIQAQLSGPPEQAVVSKIREDLACAHTVKCVS